MSAGNQNALYILVAFISLLFVILIGSVLYLYFRKQKAPLPDAEPEQKIKDEAPLEKTLTTQVQPITTNLNKSLSKTRDHFWGRIKGLFSAHAPDLSELEEILFTADIGPKMAEGLLADLSGKIGKEASLDEIKNILKESLVNVFSQQKEYAEIYDALPLKENTLNVWMISGVNGAGKTTSIGKLAAFLAKDGKKVMLAAGDTFRAAAQEQLKIWTERAQVEVFVNEQTKDPAAIAFEATQLAKQRGFDVLIVDTAGRLHTQKNLMEEIKKIQRVLDKALPGAPTESLIVIDANQGQNALMQAKEFAKGLGLTGVILTKMDGTAKGGVALGIAKELSLPIKLMGVGEKPDDLKVFKKEAFIDSILEG